MEPMLVPRARALGPLGSRVGLPWPLGWALPLDTQAEEILEAVRIDFSDGILLWSQSSGLLIPRTPRVPALKPSAACVFAACKWGLRVDLGCTLL